MTLKQHLLHLRWKTFESYPPQGTSIYIHCYVPNKRLHKFVKINNFNAVNFDYKDLIKDKNQNLNWQYSWLPEDVIDKNYDNHSAP